MATTSPDCKVRVFTYNILTPHLCSPEIFPRSAVNDLDASTRFNRVVAILEAEVDKGAVICLQEVSLEWAGKLHAFFLSQNYTFVCQLYKFKGVMGVGIAFPNNGFRPKDVIFKKIGGIPDWLQVPRTSSIFRRIGSITRGALLAAVTILSLGFIFHEGPKALSKKQRKKLLKRQAKEAAAPIRLPKFDPLSGLRSLDNDVLFLTLQPTKPEGKPFCIATYHVPHTLYRPAATFIVARLAQIVTSLGHKHPVVLAGDFNFTPSTGAYRLLGQRKLEATHSDFPVVPQLERWRPLLNQGLRSAYAMYNYTSSVLKRSPTPSEIQELGWKATVDELIAKEKPFTMHTYGVYRFSTGYSIETRDYIFVNNKVAIQDVLPLKYNVDRSSLWPSATEPSDHCPIAADLLV